MLRSLLIATIFAAALAACSPAEPPLLIDGAKAPATRVSQAPPAEPQPTGENDKPVSS